MCPVCVAPYRVAQAGAVVRLWNRSMGRQFPLSLHLFRQNSEQTPGFRPEDSRLLLDGDSVIGYVLTKRFREHDALAGLVGAHGWIEAIVIDPAYQRRGLGRQLLEWARQHLREDGAQRLFIGGGFRHFFPGVPVDLPGAHDFFQQAGYRPFSTDHDLRGSLAGFAAPPAAQAALSATGATLTLSSAADVPALLDFMRAEFPGRWRYDIEHYVAAGHDLQDVVILKQGQRVIGFAQIFHPGSSYLGPSIYWHRLLGRRYGGLGPMGVAASVRGQGLGLVLLQLALQRLADLGVQQAAIDWTKLVSFYARVGFAPWKTYVRMDDETLPPQ